MVWGLVSNSSADAELKENKSGSGWSDKKRIKLNKCKLNARRFILTANNELK